MAVPSVLGIGMNANTNPGANAIGMPPSTWPAGGSGSGFGSTLNVRGERIRWSEIGGGGTGWLTTKIITINYNWIIICSNNY